jgi:hypothetical protein
MRRLGIVGLCLAAMLAVAGLVAADASAAEPPTYKVCVKTTPKDTGEYTNSSCATKAAEAGTGAYELDSWEDAKKRGFKGKSGSVIRTAYIPGVGIDGTILCAKAEYEGEITGPSEGTLMGVFEKCETSGWKENSPGEPAGDVKTNTLDTRLVWLNPPTDTEVGIVVEAPGEGVIDEFNFEEHIRGYEFGSVVGKVTGDVGKISKESAATFSVNKSTGEQIPGEAEGVPHILYVSNESEAFTGTLPFGLEAGIALKGEALEID